MNKPFPIRRTLIGLLAAAFLSLLLILVWQLAADPDNQSAGKAPDNDAAFIQRGAYLARAGNCIACHTQRGGQAYAGGRAIATPFGDVYASNITPDKATGIGNWTADEFWRALHNGRSKDGSFLYPAFPYPNYTKVTREDSDALYAFLRSLPAVQQTNKAPDLRFPYNQRVLLAFWRALYFTPGSFAADASQSAEWNRGAYLVQGLGHCSACHTSRNALGGTAAEHDLSGALIPMLNWHASSLTSNADTGMGAWEAKDIAALLKTGVSAQGAVFGPMAEIVSKSLQYLSDEDIRSMASYLKTIPDTRPAKKVVSSIAEPEAKAMLTRGAKLYDQHCADCHGVDGKGKAPAYPSLAGKVTLTSGSPVNPIRIVLNGGFPPSTAGNPRPYGMPPFGYLMSNDEVAAVVSYIRTQWGNQGSLVGAIDVARSRSMGSE